MGSLTFGLYFKILRAIFIFLRPRLYSLAGGRTEGEAAGSLKEAKRAGREEARRARERQGQLGQSLSTPLVQKELELLERGRWMQERKDVSGRFGALPPIAVGKKVVPDRAMAFTVAVGD